MRPFGATISLDEARAIIDRSLRPIDRIERVPLETANGRVLSKDVVASADVPPFSRVVTGMARVNARPFAHGNSGSASVSALIPTI